MEICERLRLYREGVKVSRVDFALAVKLDSNALAAVEYGRRPLRMEAAHAILSVCWLSPAWLARGGGANDVPYFGPLSPKQLGVSPRALFSEVFDTHLSKLVEASEVAWSNRPEVKHGEIGFTTDDEGRTDAVSWLETQSLDWFSKVPDDRMNEFLNAVIYHAKDLLASYPKEPVGRVKKRHSEIEARVDKMQSWLRQVRRNRKE